MSRPAKFLSELKLIDVDGSYWLIDEPFRFYSAELHRTLIVPAGTPTDLASIPWGLWNFFPKSGKYNKAAVIHDAAYNHRLIDSQGYPVRLSKKAADNLFLEGMNTLEVGKWRARLMYWAVHIFGRMKKSPVEA